MPVSDWSRFVTVCIMPVYQAVLLFVVSYACVCILRLYVATTNKAFQVVNTQILLTKRIHCLQDHLFPYLCVY